MVGLAEHVVLPLVKAGGARRDVLLVVGALSEPCVGDGQAEGHVGAQARGEPLIAEELGGVVEVRVDEHHLDPELLHPEAPDGALEGGVDAAAGGLGVGRPEDHHLGVLEGIFEQIVLLRNPKAMAVAPHRHSAPVPALPAVGIVGGVSESHEVQEAVVGAVSVADVAPEVVGAFGGEDRTRAVLVPAARDLVGDDVERLVPGDRFVAGDPSVVGVACALVVEVDALEGRQDALRRVDQRALRLSMRRERGATRRHEPVAARLYDPVALVVVVKVDGRQPNDPAVFDIDEDGASGRAVGQSCDFSHAPLTSASAFASGKRPRQATPRGRGAHPTVRTCLPTVRASYRRSCRCSSSTPLLCRADERYQLAGLCSISLFAATQMR